MTRAGAVSAGATALALGLLAGCSDRGGDAGSATPVDPASVPDTAAAVEGPAIRGSVRTPDGAAVPGAPFDLRVAEDSRLLVTARQTGRLKGRETTMSATNVLPGNLVPASRDASCALTDSRGRQRSQEPCGLTDGVLGSSWSPDDDPRCAQGPCPGKLQNDHRDVVVRLPRPVSATLLVVRGCAFTCKVSVSADGRRWRELPEPSTGAPTDGFYVQTLSGAPVRAVRVTTATGGFFTKLREVSVFR